MDSKCPCVYIMASQRNGTLYTGVTSDLLSRAYQHKHEPNPGFTKRYHVSQLVYYECHGDMENAIMREKQIKKWKRLWKIRLIEDFNPTWKDLYFELQKS